MPKEKKLYSAVQHAPGGDLELELIIVVVAVVAFVPHPAPDLVEVDHHRQHSRHRLATGADQQGSVGASVAPVVAN